MLESKESFRKDPQLLLFNAGSSIDSDGGIVSRRLHR